MRGLVMDFPGDPAVRRIDDEYLLGRAFLVAPVTEFRARRRPVYLPAGATWYDFYGGRRSDGGQRIAADAPYERMPLFVRAGSIVPVGPAIQHSGQAPGAPVTLYVYTGADGRFSLYEDDGVSMGYERGAYSRIPVSWNERSRTLTIGARTGTWPGMPARRTFNVRWIYPGRPLDLDAAPDSSLRYSGRAVTVRR
jgi:alpha-D-xyloside xylohydrolase